MVIYKLKVITQYQPSIRRVLRLEQAVLDIYPAILTCLRLHLVGLVATYLNSIQLCLLDQLVTAIEPFQHSKAPVRHMLRSGM